jgi:hypothetical protein
LWNEVIGGLGKEVISYAVDISWTRVSVEDLGIIKVPGNLFKA